MDSSHSLFFRFFWQSKQYLQPEPNKRTNEYYLSMYLNEWIYVYMYIIYMYMHIYVHRHINTYIYIDILIYIYIYLHISRAPPPSPPHTPCAAGNGLEPRVRTSVVVISACIHQHKSAYVSIRQHTSASSLVYAQVSYWYLPSDWFTFRIHSILRRWLCVRMHAHTSSSRPHTLKVQGLIHW